MTRMPVPFLRVITGTLPVEAVKAKARERGVSVNDYLAGVICYAFLRLQQMEGNRRLYPVKLSVPGQPAVVLSLPHGAEFCHLCQSRRGSPLR